MSVMFLKQLRLHRDQLAKRLQGAGPGVERELAQTRQFLSATKDKKWKAQLIKRINALEAAQEKGPDVTDVQRRHELVSQLYQAIEHHPDYNKTRKRRTSKG